MNNTDRQFNKLLEVIEDKRSEFFKEHSIMPNAIEISPYMYALIMKHCGLSSPFLIRIGNEYKIERPKIYGMKLYISRLIDTKEDINVYYVKGE